MRGTLQVGTGSLYLTNDQLAASNGALTLSSVATSTINDKLVLGGNVWMNGLSTDATTIGIPGVICLNTSNQLVKLSGVATCIISSAQFKHSIESLDTGIADLMRLRPVSFIYNSDNGSLGKQIGFIAEEVETVDPRLVVHSASGTPFSVRYENMTALLAQSIQEIVRISDVFKSNLIAWLGDAGNGIGDFFAKEGHFETVCVKKADGTEFCANGDQLATALAGAASAGGDSSPVLGGGVTSGAESATSTPPEISINGANPATIHIGDTYADLGASIIGPATALNLGIHTFVGSTPLEQAFIDTSATSTYHIHYVVTDQWGQTATATREVMVVVE